MSSIIFRIPNADIIRERFLQKADFSQPYFQKKEVLQAIVDLAIQRFLGKEIAQEDIRLEAQLMIADLRSGFDGFKGHALPKFQLDWAARVALRDFIEETIISCGETPV